MRLFGVGALCALSCASWGVVAYDNFDASDTYNDSSGATLMGPTHHVGWDPMTVAYQFTSLETGVLDRITIALREGWNSDYTVVNKDFYVRLIQDDGANHLGALLKEFAVQVNPANKPYPYAPTVIGNSDSSLSLEQGKKYWVQAFVLGDSNGSWQYEAIDVPDRTTANIEYAISYNQGTDWGYYDVKYAGAYRVEVKPASVGAVPEPTTIALAGLALAAAARRRKRA